MSRLVVVSAVATMVGCGILTPGASDDTLQGSGGSQPSASGGQGTIDFGTAGGSSECEICRPEGPACVLPSFKRICLTRDQLNQCDPELGAVDFGIALCDEVGSPGEGGAGTAGASADDACPRVEDLTFGSFGGNGCGACSVSPFCPSGPALHVDENGEETSECCYLVRLSCGIC